jgi:hypothetical protein
VPRLRDRQRRSWEEGHCPCSSVQLNSITSVMYQRTPLLSPHAETASSPFPRLAHLQGPTLAHAVFLHDPRASDRRERYPNKVDRNSLWRQASERPGTSLLQKQAFHSWCGMPADDCTFGIIGCLAELPLHLQAALEPSQHRSSTHCTSRYNSRVGSEQRLPSRKWVIWRRGQGGAFDWCAAGVIERTTRRYSGRWEWC